MLFSIANLRHMKFSLEVSTNRKCQLVLSKWFIHEYQEMCKGCTKCQNRRVLPSLMLELQEVVNSLLDVVDSIADTEHIPLPPSMKRFLTRP